MSTAIAECLTDCAVFQDFCRQILFIQLYYPEILARVARGEYVVFYTEGFEDYWLEASDSLTDFLVVKS